MSKLLTIALKDLRIAFSDTSALILMLATPFAISLAITFAFGGLGSQGGSGIEEIPVTLVNQDDGLFGELLVETFQSPELADLFAPEMLSSPQEARQRVDADESAAAVIIPAGFSDAVFQELTAGEASAEVEIYANPTRPISVSVVRSITGSVLGRINASYAAGHAAVEGLIASGLLDPQQAGEVAPQIGQRAGEQVFNARGIRVERVQGAGQREEASEFNWAGYFAPSMAIMFLMFTVTSGARTLLAERDNGTLQRIFAAPTRPWQMIGGKVLGTFLIGVLQMTILALATRFLLGVRWGPPEAVAALITAVVFAATGWGVLLAAYARSAGQVEVAGTVISLVFGAAAGNFVPRFNLPAWLQQASYISPNAWGLEGFNSLASGGALVDILPAIQALVIMGAVLFALSLLAYRRQMV